MIGPCMCGDSACPSCGPAQGYDPAYELVVEFLCESFATPCGDIVNPEWLSETVADVLGKDQEMADALLAWAQRKQRAYRQERAMPHGEDWFNERRNDS